jgi:hypothetical protein
MLLYSHFQKFKLNCLPKTRSVFYKTAETVTKTGLWVSDFRTVIVHSFGYGSAVLVIGVFLPHQSGCQLLMPPFLLFVRFEILAARQGNGLSATLSSKELNDCCSFQSAS